VIRPVVAKFTSACLAGARLPEPETMLSTTPFSTVTVRSETSAALEERPRLSTPPTIAATASSPSSAVSTAGRRRLVVDRPRIEAPERWRNKRRTSEERR
jgi:hypothetical protein